MWTRSKTKQNRTKKGGGTGRKNRRGERDRGKGRRIFFSSSHFFKKPTQENTHTHNQRLFPSRNINRAESNTLFFSLPKKKKKVKVKERQGLRLRPLGAPFRGAVYKGAAETRGFVQHGAAARGKEAARGRGGHALAPPGAGGPACRVRGAPSESWAPSGGNPRGPRPL